MIDLWRNLEKEQYSQFLETSDVRTRQEIVSTIINGEDIDYSHQRELILDQLYSVLVFSVEIELQYEMIASLLKFLVGEFTLLMDQSYDYGAEQRFRAWVNEQVLVYLLVLFMINTY